MDALTKGLEIVLCLPVWLSSMVLCVGAAVEKEVAHMNRERFKEEKMRAPFQILAIPYTIMDGSLHYCLFHRADSDQWQFIAGGGEDDETPVEAAKREILEESGATADNLIELKSICYIPADIFPKRHLYHWTADTYVVPEYSFAFDCKEEINLSHEHTAYVWLTFEGARSKLKWDSNKTALYALNCRLEAELGAEQEFPEALGI